MSGFYERYQQGFYQEVYDLLMAEGERVFEQALYEDALSVAREMMRRVRYNLEELLIPRLKQIGYRFGDGSWDHPDNLSEEELRLIQQDEPMLLSPTKDTPEIIVALEQLVGTLPLTLKCWYEEIGAVNLLGAFPSSTPQSFGGSLYKRGYGLDPLYTQSLIDVYEELRDFTDDEERQKGVLLPISPDKDFKYGYSGGGSYEIEVPCRAFDGLLLGEEHGITFVEYLRLCFRWGGFPGLENHSLLSTEEFNFLTKDLQSF